MTSIVARKNSDGPKFTDVYELFEKIGQGAFSKVHRCIHLKENKEYAAKIISTEKLNVRQKDKLDREARICRMLSHKSIVTLHFTSNEDKRYYMVFDLIQGGELFDDIVARENYCEQDASHCIQQVLGEFFKCMKGSTPNNIFCQNHVRLFFHGYLARLLHDLCFSTRDHQFHYIFPK